MDCVSLSKERSCGVPVTVTGASNTPSGSTKVLEGSNVVYTCNSPSYVHTSGDLTRTCQSDGTLTGTPPVCSKHVLYTSYLTLMYEGCAATVRVCHFPGI